MSLEAGVHYILISAPRFRVCFIQSVPANHYSDVMMNISNHRRLDVCSNVCSGADQRNIKAPCPWPLWGENHRWSVVSPHKEPVTRKMIPFDDVIMSYSFCYILTPGDAYIRGVTKSSLVQVIAYRLFGNKPLLELMLAYCELDPQGQIAVKFEIRYKHFLSRKCIWKLHAHVPNADHFVQASKY